MFCQSLNDYIISFFHRYNCSRVLVTNVLAISICLAFIPVWSIYYGMLITVGLLGINMGMIDTVANVNLIKIHGREVGNEEKGA